MFVKIVDKRIDKDVDYIEVKNNKNIYKKSHNSS